MSASTDDRRYHSLDHLRAVMMLLGLVLHSAASFAVAPLGLGWPYKDSETSIVFDVLVFFIHVFRMPIFFIIAGFFAALLYYRRGGRIMLANRTARIVVPFVLFLALTFPATISGFIFSNAGGVNGGWARAVTYLANPAAWYANLNTIHLWFLYYLILFYAVILLATPLLQRVVRPWSARIVSCFERLILHPLGIVLLSGTTLVTLLPMSYTGLDTETGFLVQPKVLIAYGVFMIFGWLLYLNRDQIDRFSRQSWPLIIAGLALSTAYLVYMINYPPGTAGPRLIGIGLAALSMWTLCYGIIGLFVRYCDQPKPVGRYLCDASYWLYLVHLPFTIWIPGLMNGWPISAFAKFSITLTVTTAVGLVTYHYLVRATVIGVLLNGKRYPRALPRYDEQRNYIRS